MKLCTYVLMWFAAATCVFPLAASAQGYPVKPVRIIVPFGPGTGPDTVLRVIGDKLSRIWGQQVVVDNRPGANGFIALETGKKAPPDGYTFVQADDAQLTVSPHLYNKIPYDPAADFEPVATLFRVNFFLVVPAASPWKDVRDMVAAAKAKPGSVQYGTWGVGSAAHLGAKSFEAATSTEMAHVPYKDAAQVVQGVAAGDLSWAFASAATSQSMYRAKRVQYLAVAAPKRSAAFPEVPTVAEAGGPADLEVKAWVTLQAPKGTPKAIIAKVNADINKVLTEPDVRERLTGIGLEPFRSSPEEVTKMMESDSRKNAEVIKRGNVTVDN